MTGFSPALHPLASLLQRVDVALKTSMGTLCPNEYAHLANMATPKDRREMHQIAETIRAMSAAFTMAVHASWKPLPLGEGAMGMSGIGPQVPLPVSRNSIPDIFTAQNAVDSPTRADVENASASFDADKPPTLVISPSNIMSPSEHGSTPIAVAAEPTGLEPSTAAAIRGLIEVLLHASFTLRGILKDDLGIQLQIQQQQQQQPQAQQPLPPLQQTVAAAAASSSSPPGMHPTPMSTSSHHGAPARHRLSVAFFDPPADIDNDDGNLGSTSDLDDTLRGGGHSLTGHNSSLFAGWRRPSTFATTPHHLATPSAALARIMAARTPRGKMATPTMPRPRNDSVWSVSNGVTAAETNVAAVSGEDFDGTSTVNQYVLLHSLGRGTQGEVMLALDTITNAFRAIKVVAKAPAGHSAVAAPSRPTASSPQDVDTPDGEAASAHAAADAGGGIVVASIRSRLQRSRDAAVNQLQSEVTILKRCRHRNVVALYEVIDDPAVNSLYLVMQYVEKGSLVTMSPTGVPDRTIAPDTLAGYTRQLCAGLLYLHNHGIIHRDIKPDNILLGNDDVVFLSDFGVSECFGTEASAAVSGTKGTSVFVAPELLGEGTDKCDGTAVDVWALGLSLYVMLYGRLPFPASNRITYWEAVCSTDIVCPSRAPPPPGSSAEVELDTDWLTLLSGMLQRDPAKRFKLPTIRALARQLAEAAEARELGGSSPLTSEHLLPNSPELTPIVHISDWTRDALQGKALPTAATPTAAQASRFPRGNMQHRMSLDDPPTRRDTPSS